MEVLGLILMIIGPLVIAGGGFYLVKRARKIANAVTLDAFSPKKEFLYFSLLNGGIGLGLMLFFLGIPFYWHTPNLAYEWVCIIFGGFLLGLEAAIFYVTFRLYYWQAKLDKRTKRWSYWIMITMVPLMLLTLVLLTEGFANHLTYPLINGISFHEGFHFTTAQTDTPLIAWYALCIIGGAVLVYFICDHFMYQEYGKHGLLESTFLIAFPAGIIGARIWYCIGEWEQFADNFWEVFNFRNGGLTILGGAITGIVVGVLWFRWRHKDISIGKAVNIIVPTILVAQAVGRWGNFFNAEVHGLEVSGEAWKWLPTVIYKQMEVSAAVGKAQAGNIFVPLFFIESLVNLGGYFLIAFGIGKGLKKYVKPCDLAFGYVAWYGLTRVIMEPLRHSAYMMGSEKAWSWTWSILFVGFGLLAIIINHIIRYCYNKAKHPDKLPVVSKENTVNANIVLALASICLPLTTFVIGLEMYLNNVIPQGSVLIALCPHNIGLILWVISVCIFPAAILPIIKIINAYKGK